MLSSRIAPWLGVLGLGAGGGILLNQGDAGNTRDVQLLTQVPSRQQQVAALSTSKPDNPFDLLVIGGGATGSGIALDAATRGLKTALIEREDFASGTSSKSTKLVHGGVRYLEKAVFNLDYGQLKLVYEALQERKDLLENAPHLTRTLPILMPCYKFWEVPFYWAGLKAYDLVAGTKNLAWSKYLAPSESERRLPTLAPRNHQGKSLKGTILYYDGQFDDDSNGLVVGVHARDKQTGKRLDVHAKVVINATGPFVDRVRELGDSAAKPAVTGSSGAHITLPEWYGSAAVGMIVPKTKDHVIAGTTDSPCPVTDRPQATAEEVSFILAAISDFLSIKVRQDDILSVWSGIRPLAYDPTVEASGTAGISRDHLIFSEPDGLITVTGGKWTTYRLMAEDSVNTALATGKLQVTHQCVTSKLKLLGAQGYHANYHVEVAQQASALLAGSPACSPSVARHLASAYGDLAPQVLQLAAAEKLGGLLVPGQPYLEAEVVHACRHEYCTTVEDFLARRTRLAFLDVAAAEAAIPRVAELMAAELRWGSYKKRCEVKNAKVFLAGFKRPPVLPHPAQAASQTTAAA
eukprot:gene6063-6301_t